MKTLLLTTTILVAAFSTSAMAGNDCTAMIEKFDKAIVESQVSDDAKMKALEMREQGARQQADGDDKACQATLTAALQQLNG